MSKKVVEEFVFRNIRYQRQLTRCNKKSCTKCPHGPYWYAIINTPVGRPAVRYVGKQLRGDVAAWYNGNGGNLL